MLFTSKFSSRIWDTWLYFHEGTFYLYYLITEEYPGAGFGVATSNDGVHWEDHGPALLASADMQRYLGTGSVWKDPDFARTGRFLCNYSEWRLEANRFVQYIFFAWSDDLLHWHKLAKEAPFGPDERFYKRTEEDARWDCIWTVDRPEGGFYGYWTATPHSRPGFGFGESRDGLHWKALEPPTIDWGEVPEFRSIEVGAVQVFDETYYAMLGDYTPTNAGMYTFLSDSSAGPFRPAPRNFVLLHNRARMHAYFTRFFALPGEILVNHHATSYDESSGKTSITYFAPLKKAVLRDGTLYLGWWPGNERLKQRSIESLPLEDGSLRFDPSRGLLLEGALELPGNLRVITRAPASPDAGVEIRVDGNGIAEIGLCEGNTFLPEERIDRQIAFQNPASFRLLLRHKLLEFYLDDMLIQAYSLLKAPAGLIVGSNLQNIKLWEWT